MDHVSNVIGVLLSLFGVHEFVLGPAITVRCDHLDASLAEILKRFVLVTDLRNISAVMSGLGLLLLDELLILSIQVGVSQGRTLWAAALSSGSTGPQRLSTTLSKHPSRH